MHILCQHAIATPFDELAVALGSEEYFVIPRGMLAGRVAEWPCRGMWWGPRDAVLDERG